MRKLSWENNYIHVKQRDGDDKTFSDSYNFELDMDLYQEIKFPLTKKDLLIEYIIIIKYTNKQHICQ